MFKKEQIEDKLKYGGYSSEIFSLVPAGSKVLDLGCSTGLLARFLKERKNCRVIGVDIDRSALKEALPFCQEMMECDMDDLKRLDYLLADIFFDVIAIGDVLEHLKYPEGLLELLKEHLRDDGVIIASIPNSAFISLRIKFFLGDFSYDERGGLMDTGHLRFFNFATVRSLFERTGYRIQKIYGVNVVKKKFSFLIPFAKLFPKLFAIHIIIVAKK